MAATLTEKALSELGNTLSQLGEANLNFVIVVDQYGDIQLFKPTLDKAEAEASTDIDPDSADSRKISTWSITYYRNADEASAIRSDQRKLVCRPGPNGTLICVNI